MPEWLASLDEEDVSFIKKFVLASGSLKEVAGIYGVTYPTVYSARFLPAQQCRSMDTPAFR